MERLMEKPYWEGNHVVDRTMSECLEVKIELMESDNLEKKEGLKSVFKSFLSGRLKMLSGEKRAYVAARLYTDYYEALDEESLKKENSAENIRINFHTLIGMVIKLLE